MCTPCAKAKQKCEGAVWSKNAAGPSQRSEVEVGLSGSEQIADALTEVVTVLRGIKNKLEGIREAVEDRFRVETPKEEDSEPELEVDQEELAELPAESAVFEGYKTWLVEMGRYQWEREEEEE